MDRFRAKDVCHDLQEAFYLLNHLCLSKSASWAGEMLSDLVQSSTSLTEEYLETPYHFSVFTDSYFYTGKDFFDQMEYLQAGDYFEKSHADHATFLKFLSNYMALQKHNGEKCLDPGRIDHASDEDIAFAQKHLANDLEKNKGNNPFLAYLLALLLIDLRQMQKAESFLRESLAHYPCNWGAWEALIGVLPWIPQANQEVIEMEHWMKPLAKAIFLNNQHQHKEALREVHSVEKLFRNARFVKELKASILIKMEDYTQAEKLFKNVRTIDPHRLDAVTYFSKSLLKTDVEKEALCELATACSQTDGYRPESICVQGDYFASMEKHSQAIECFERALMIDKCFLYAWVRLGFELQMTKQYEKAKGVFHRVMEMDPKNCDAFFALGEIHEALGSPAIAVYHIKQALRLKSDSRYWRKLGSLYHSEAVKKLPYAIECYRKAYEVGDPTGEAISELSQLYQITQDLSNAEEWHRKNVERLAADPRGFESEFAHSALFVAKQCLQRREFDEVLWFCNQLDPVMSLLDEELHGMISSVKNQLERALEHPHSEDDDDRMTDD